MTAKAGQIRIGIGGWTFEPWRGTFYPKGLPHAKELGYASERLTSIEVNGTFYRTQTPATFRKWASEVPDGFVFSIKGPRYATNRSVLKDAGDFGKFLELLPVKLDGRKLRHVVEVRHPSFCSPEFIALVREFETPVVFAEHAKYPAIADSTGDFIYARLQKGEDDIPTAYPPKEIAAWTKRAETWAKGAAPADLALTDPAKKAKTAPRDVFVYFIHEGKVRAPAAAMAMIERLGA